MANQQTADITRRETAHPVIIINPANWQSNMAEWIIIVAVAFIAVHLYNNRRRK